jgi:uncharacterized protein (DUF1800 family)
MKQFKRSEFLNLATAAFEKDGKLNTSHQPPVNEFANKTLPTFSSRSNTTLAAYSGTFGTAQLSHLLRRTLFGLTKSDLDAFTGQTLDQVLTSLLTPSTAPAPPVNAYNNTNFTDADIPLGQTWVNAPQNTNSVNANGQRKKSFKFWWVGLMLNQERNLTEKMTLFWHNHFATELNIYTDARFAYKHNALLRANALGNFKTLTRLVTTDPAMLSYLNGNTNTKNAPNENYGRELQELFTVGKYPIPHYTEDDVKAAAKVLTGWRIDNNAITSYFDSTKHDDTSDKVFSANYGSTTIAAQSGANGALETDQLIDMIFLQAEAAKNICRKLYRWFVYYVIDTQVETDIITPMADLVVQNNWDIVPALRALLKSEHFFDTLNFGCHIKNPVDHLVGMARQFNLVFPASTDLVNQYKGWKIVADALATLTMDPGDPPSVAGWTAYYQEPQYHEQWINSDTLPSRNQYTDTVASLNGVTQSGVNLKIDHVAFAKQFSNPGDPNQLIADSVALLSPNDIGATQTAFLKTILLSNQAADHYWTDAWNQYISSPGNTTYFTTVDSRLRSMYTYLMDMAEYQLI